MFKHKYMKKFILDIFFRNLVIGLAGFTIPDLLLEELLFAAVMLPFEHPHRTTKSGVARGRVVAAIAEQLRTRLGRVAGH